MTGFIKGLFRSKPKAEAVETQETEIAELPQKPGAYYLAPDDAKTFGNLEYMRSEKVIRRSFPKAKLGKDNEVIRRISATGMIKELENASPSLNGAVSNGAVINQVNGKSQPTAPSRSETEDRRRLDSSMDIFRNMARDMKR